MTNAKTFGWHHVTDICGSFGWENSGFQDLASYQEKTENDGKQNKVDKRWKKSTKCRTNWTNYADESSLICMSPIPGAKYRQKFVGISFAFSVFAPAIPDREEIEHQQTICKLSWQEKLYASRISFLVEAQYNHY